MFRARSLLALAGLLPILSLSVASETLPRLEGQTLTGKKLVLPDAAHGRGALLVFGFSREAQRPATDWEQRFDRDHGSGGQWVCCAIAVLESVPGPFRGLVAGNMGRGLSPEQRDRFVLLFHDERVWKQRVGFQKAEDAYLLLIDRSGRIRWRFHGPFTETAYEQLQEQLPRLAR
jgi:hypothetical protein